jgi:6-pyruvoyltetrahydropterin/6-carboxytetrahydropterin synthase
MNKNISYITRKTSLSLAHKLYNSNWSSQKNIEIYGKCSNCHGHNFNLFVTIKGEIDQDSGMVINFSDLKNVIDKEVCSKIDHKFLNNDVAEFKDIVPTSENICLVIWSWLKPKLPNLFEIKLEETGNNTTTYRGE